MAQPARGPSPHGLDLQSVEGHPTVKQLIYEALRDHIAFGELPPGARLVEADLAARFGVSKTPVREALLTLEAEGLVTLRAHRGAEVSRLSLAEYRDLQFARDALEFGALHEVMATLTDADLSRAAEHLAEMEQAFAAGDYRRYRRGQRQLHEALLTIPGHPTVTQLALNLNTRMDRFGVVISHQAGWWARELDVSRQRLAFARRRDADGLIAMLKQWHSDVIEGLTQRFHDNDLSAMVRTRSLAASGTVETAAEAVGGD